MNKGWIEIGQTLDFVSNKCPTTLEGAPRIRTISLHPFELTMVSYRAVPGATIASIACIFDITILIENTVVLGPLKGIPHAHFIVKASLNTVFNARD